MTIFNSIEVLSDAFIGRLTASYQSAFGTPGGQDGDYGNTIRAAANMAVETIAQSDAPYRDVEHTIPCTMHRHRDAADRGAAYDRTANTDCIA